MPDGQKYEDWIKTSEGKKYLDLQKQYGDDLQRQHEANLGHHKDMEDRRKDEEKSGPS